MSDVKTNYWRVHLRASPPDIEYLKLFPLDWEIESTDRDYFLVSPYFNDLQKASEVRGVADKMLSLAQLAAMVSNQALGPVKVTGTKWVNERGQPVVSVEARFVIGVGIRSKSLSPTENERPIEDIVSDLRDDKNLQKIAEVLKSDDNWTYSHWKIYEIIRNDIAPESKAEGTKRMRDEFGWMTDDELKRFATLNDPDAHGYLSARHAVRDKSRFHVRNPMTCSESTRFVMALLNKWLRWKSHVT